MDVKSVESSVSNSISNNEEANVVVEIIKDFKLRGVHYDEIAVLSSYTDQMRLIKSKLDILDNSEDYYKQVVVASINAFQVNTVTLN